MFSCDKIYDFIISAKYFDLMTLSLLYLLYIHHLNIYFMLTLNAFFAYHVYIMIDLMFIIFILIHICIHIHMKKWTRLILYK